jgi:hypothetical protein
MKRTYRVLPSPNTSDEAGVTHFTIEGPRLDEFAEMDRIAKLLEAVLNAASQFAKEATS